MTCIFTQTYYLLFRYVHGHSIVARVTSNSCKICLQVFRVTVQAVQAAAVFLPPLLIMVSECMFCLWLWCRGAPHCFTSTNPPPRCRSSRLLCVGLYKFVTRLATRRSLDTDSKLEMPAAVGLLHYVLCSAANNRHLVCFALSLLVHYIQIISSFCRQNKFHKC